MEANILNLPHYFTQVYKNVSVHLMITVQKQVSSNNLHKTDALKMAITEYSYIRNVDCAILNTASRAQFGVNKSLETGGGHYEHYL
jgi:hypothetical protein